MKIAQLFSIFNELKWGNSAALEVRAVTQDSKSVGPGSVFVAIRGATIDGHKFLPAVCAAGAAAVVVEDAALVPRDFSGAVVQVASTRSALDRLARKFYDDPARSLFCIGVTGTNGKTTVTYMIEKILNDFGWPTGVIGTIDHHLLGHHWPSHLTTPDALTLQHRFRQFVDLGARAAAFEVSSHALHQARVDSVPFRVGVFTNFTRDHLDYHGDMSNYFKAKEYLFSNLLTEGATAILNGDDPEIRRLHVREGVTTRWFGTSDCDFTFRILQQSLGGTLFHLASPQGECEIRLGVPGRHNVYNAVAAIAATIPAGVSLESAGAALAAFNGAPGRLERVAHSKTFHVFVDYAHTDDALRSVLRALGELRISGGSSSRIITVFGCGGDRDRGKRPLMARAACENSDVVVITSDNPRSEEAYQIIEDIRTGVPKGWAGELHIEIDRRKALKVALQTAREGDVILIAGKGHEDYQIIGKTKHPFSDTKVVTELLRG